MSARDRFVLTRKYVVELDAIKARLMEHGDDWRPEGVKVQGPSDPTEKQAEYNIDVLGGILDELRARERDLESFIGVTLVIIQRVRDGLGDDYGELLERRYVDNLTWRDCDVTLSTGKRKCSIAFDWIDSLGLERLIAGEYDL